MRVGSEKEQKSLGPRKYLPESRLYSQKRSASIRDQVEASRGEGHTKERRRKTQREANSLPSRKMPTLF